MMPMPPLSTGRFPDRQLGQEHRGKKQRLLLRDASGLHARREPLRVLPVQGPRFDRQNHATSNHWRPLCVDGRRLPTLHPPPATYEFWDCIQFLAFNFGTFLAVPGHKRGRGFCAAFWILPEKGLDVKADVAKSLEAMKTSFKLLKTENILLLSVYTVYSGILLGFWSGVYGTALSRTEWFEDPKSMPG